MKRKTSIDLTPMLDVVLLLVFGFMFVVAATNTELLQKKQDVEQKQEQFIQLKQELQTQIEQKDQSIDALEKEVEQLTQQKETQIKAISQLKQSVQQYFFLNESEIYTILQKANANEAAKVFGELSDEQQTANSVIMYDLLKKEFFFVEVEIKGEQNRIYINNQMTQVSIFREEVNELTLQNAKIDEIKNAISKVLDDRIGGSSMAFVTLSTDNEAIYHYAWTTAWSAIKQLEEKYGAKNYFCAQLYITE